MINHYEIKDGVAVIYLSIDKIRRKSTIVDIKTLNKLLQRDCSLMIGDRKGYVFIWFKDTKQKFRFHRWVLDCPAHLTVDHISGDKRDNRTKNLQVVTRSQNTRLMLARRRA